MPALGNHALLLASTEPLIPAPSPEMQAAFRAAFLTDALGPRWCEQHGHFELDITCVGHGEKWIVCGSCGIQRQEEL